MPKYEMICPQCFTEYEIFSSIADFDKNVESAKCNDCKLSYLEMHYRSTPNMVIPGSFTYDGKVKVLCGKDKGRTKEQARVPINIVDYKPDGTATVTRIGNKKDIENE